MTHLAGLLRNELIDPASLTIVNKALQCPGQPTLRHVENPIRILVLLEPGGLRHWHTLLFEQHHHKMRRLFQLLGHQCSQVLLLALIPHPDRCQMHVRHQFLPGGSPDHAHQSGKLCNVAGLAETGILAAVDDAHCVGLALGRAVVGVGEFVLVVDAVLAGWVVEEHDYARLRFQDSREVFLGDLQDFGAAWVKQLGEGQQEHGQAYGWHFNNIIWALNQIRQGMKAYLTFWQYLSQSLPYFLLHRSWSLPQRCKIIITKKTGQQKGKTPVNLQLRAQMVAMTTSQVQWIFLAYPHHPSVSRALPHQVLRYLGFSRVPQGS